MKIGILGGTFNPPHLGHLALAEAAQEALQLDEVIFMPAHRNPLKAKGAAIPAKHRLEMVKRLVADRPGLAFSDLEVSRAGQSYAVDTLSELQHVQPGDYWFIMGADALKSLPEWKQPNRLIKLCRLAVVARRPVDPEELLKRFPDEFRNAIDIVEMKPIDISASDLRDKIARGQSVSQWVPKPVVQYIEEHKLYKF